MTVAAFYVYAAFFVGLTIVQWVMETNPTDAGLMPKRYVLVLVVSTLCTGLSWFDTETTTRRVVSGVLTLLLLFWYAWFIRAIVQRKRRRAIIMAKVIPHLKDGKAVKP